MLIFDIDGCEEKIGYSFKDKMLLRRCFTHASYGYEHNEEDNEILEYFGDAIIQFVVTEYLYKNEYGNEGDLTKKRADIVSLQPLLNCVKKMGLDKFVLLGNGQGRASNREEKLFSSIYEALVAGIYLDGGMAATKKFIYDTIIADYDKIKQRAVKTKKESAVDYKSAFQEYVQKRKLGSIEYVDLWKKGPDHLPTFRVAVSLNGTRLAEAEGQSKKSAQANAAKSALGKIKKQGGKNK